MRTCSVPNCDRPHRAKGLCTTHYGRLQRGTDVDAPVHPRGESRNCTRPGCDRKHKANGLCRTHYSRQQRGLDMDAPVQPRRKGKQIKGRTCMMPNCDQKHNANGLCTTHYTRQLKGLDMDAPIRRGRTVYLRQFLLSALWSETNCTDCGGTFPAHVIEYDHLPGFEKKGNVGALSGRNLCWEVNIMQPVCANCHRTRTYLRREYDENSCDGAQRPNLVEWVRSGVPS